ncbi:hypothetical protein Ancab_011546 [Ancistrocladus abbreviatus]
MENQATQIHLQHQSCCHSPRVVLVVFPFQGHINPMLDLATILHSRGFAITICHPEFNSPDPSNHPEFTFLRIAIKNNLTTSAGGGSKMDISQLVASIPSFNNSCREPFQQSIQALMKEENGGIICIIYDLLMYFAQSIADDLNLPSISLRTSAAITLFAFAFPQSLDQLSCLTFPESISEEPELETMTLKELLPSLKTMTTNAMLTVREAAAEAIIKSAAIIVNTMDFLEHPALERAQTYFPAQIFPIGPFHKMTLNDTSLSNPVLKEAPDCIYWLDKQPPRSVLYVSFGSMASVSEAELHEIASGLANAKQPFLWVVRPGMIIQGRADSNGLLSRTLKEMVRGRGCVVSWTSQKQVLAHKAVGGFWSHCGWNSTLESICEGVPMLCRPFSGDQFVNAKYVSSVWKVGLELEKNEFERIGIEKCIRRLMVEKEGEEMREKAMVLKEKAGLCLKEEGSSTKCLNQLVDCISLLWTKTAKLI